MTQGAETSARMGEQCFHDAHDFFGINKGAGWTIYMEETYLINQVVGFEPLYKSMQKCKRGVLWKDSVASYCLNALERTIRLSDSLRDGSYTPRPTVKFRITHPKPREIASITFRDRVYQRSLNDNVVYPVMARSFIYDNYACQQGKGTDKARNRLKEFLRKHYRKHGTKGYVAQFDIKGYYPNMDHETAESMFKRKLPTEIYEQVVEILRHQYDGEKGYNAGSQLIQIVGIAILDGMDHFIKEKLHAKLYIRYMDDFMIISDDIEYLERCAREIRGYLSGLKFELHEEKTRIFPIEEGIVFLGFIFKLTETGKVLQLAIADKVKSERKKLRRQVGLAKRNILSKSMVYKSYEGWKNHVLKGNTHNVIRKMDNYYKTLWKEDIPQ